MICLNCGRPNPSGTSLCNRCRERRPGLERARGGVIYQRTRETARVTKRGPGILAVGVLLLAGLIFAGGTLAVFFAPRDAGPTNPAIAFPPGSTPTRLPIFEQETATPAPTPTATPWFPSFTPSFDLLSPTLSFGVTFAPPTPTIPGNQTPRPTRTPRPPTPTPGPSTPTPVPGPTAGFTATQQGNSPTADFTDNSTGGPTWWLWEFEGGGTSTEQNPTHPFPDFGNWDVTLTVTNGNGSDSIMKTITLSPPVTDPPPTTPPPTTPPPSSTEPPAPTLCVPPQIPDCPL